MRIIDNIEEVVRNHRREFGQIEEEFNRQNERYKALLQRDHEFIGRLLKFHLISEYYLNEYLTHRFPEIKFESVELRYYQKISLLPENDVRVQFVKKGLKELNRIRNKFSHNLDATVEMNELSEMLQVLQITRREKEYTDPANVIEEFTTAACTFLIVSPKEIDELFSNLFRELQK